MKVIASLLVVCVVCGCVTSRSTRRGAMQRSSVESTNVSESEPEVRVNNDVARVFFTRTTCRDVKRVYPTENYITQFYPGQRIALLGSLAFVGALAFMFTTLHEAFVWPEGKPGVVYLSVGLSIFTGLGTVLAGFTPWLAGGDRSREVLTSSKLDGRFDTVSKECENETFFRSRAMPYAIETPKGRTLTGTTSSSGSLNLKEPAKQALLDAPVNEAGFKSALADGSVELKVRIDDAPYVNATVRLSCLRRDAGQANFSCKMKCESAGEARCHPQYERCLERVESGRESLCQERFERCLDERVTNKPAFDACHVACLNSDLSNACR